MTPGEALHAVQAALRDHGLPGSAGLRLADRTFIVGLAPGHRHAGPAVDRLLQQMGCEPGTTDRYGYVYTRCPGKLLPAPPVVVHASSADCCSAAEDATVTAAKVCNGCGKLLPVSSFSWRNREKGWRMPNCVPCDRQRQRKYSPASA